MGSDIGCRPEPGVTSLRPDVVRDGSVSLPERHRLRHRTDFELTLAEGSRRRGAGFDVISRSNPESPGRVGFIVSRRVGNAVIRNRIRRRLRHAINSEHMKPGMDCVIVARNRVAEQEFGGLVRALGRVLDIDPTTGQS